MVSFNKKNIVRSFTSVIFGAIFMIGQVAAQSGEEGGGDGGGGNAVAQIGNAICANNGGKLLSLLFAGVAIYFVFKGAFQMFWAWDDLSSPRQQDKQEGREKLIGGAKLFGIALFFPVIFGAVLSILGVEVLSCFNFTSLMG